MADVSAATSRPPHPTSTSHIPSFVWSVCPGVSHLKIKTWVKESKLPYRQGVGKTGRDDEKEWGGIPILVPQSDDSDDEYYWFEEVSSDESDSEQHEADAGPPWLNSRRPYDDDASMNLSSQERRPPTSSKKGEKTQMSMHHINDYAFLIGPRRDGITKRKDGTVLTLQELPTTLYLRPQTRPLNRSHWTHLSKRTPLSFPHGLAIFFVSNC
jgi:hypothetical protein